jgi:hypothetical protein
LELNQFVFPNHIAVSISLIGGQLGLWREQSWTGEIEFIPPWKEHAMLPS